MRCNPMHPACNPPTCHPATLQPYLLQARLREEVRALHERMEAADHARRRDTQLAEELGDQVEI